MALSSLVLRAYGPSLMRYAKIIFRFWHTLPLGLYSPLGPYRGPCRGDGYIAPSAIGGSKEVGKFVFPYTALWTLEIPQDYPGSMVKLAEFQPRFQVIT